MSRTEIFVRRLNGLYSSAGLFIASIVLLGMLLVGSSVIAWRSHEEQARHLRITAQTIEGIDAINDVRIGVLEAIRGERGYLLTGDASFLAPYYNGRLRIRTGIARLESAGLIRRDHAHLMPQLRRISMAYLIYLDQMISARRAGLLSTSGTIHLTNKARTSIQRIGAILDHVDRDERAKLAQVASKVEGVTRLMLWNFAAMAAAGLLLLGLAAMTLIALRRSLARERQSREELRLLAQTDELTGIANRRQFLSALNRHVAQARRQGGELTLAIFDIDHFKRVNDLHGHSAGDEVLRQVAKLAGAVIRGSDIVGRIGGEEFAVLLPGTTLSVATTVCERLRAEVSHRAMTTRKDAVLPITVSIGIAELAPLEDATKLLERADAALYRAKRAGRDKVCLAA